MRILKYSIFEVNRNEYYQKLTHQEYIKQFNYLVRFSKSEFDRIKESISHEITFGIANTHLTKCKTGGFTNLSPQLKINTKRKIYEIYKKEDEWFFINEYDELDLGFANKKSEINYKCDQLEGLIQFLKDKNI